MSTTAGAPLQAIETWAAALLARLGPAERRRLALRLAQQLRTSNQQRMRAQQAPDGSAWTPRKPQGGKIRSATGRALRAEAKKGPMMRNLAKAKYLRAQATPNDATVTFVERVQRIARVHHYGENDAVNYPNPPRYDYPARPLLGISEQDYQRIQALLLEHLRR